MRKYTGLLLCLVLVIVACQPNTNNKTLRVGTSSGPDVELMRVVQDVAQQQFHLPITVIEFSDYTLPNAAVNDGSIDANIFQHQPYLDATIKDRHYKLVTVGKTFVYPMGLYSKQLKDLTALPDKAVVAIPNDPSNEARSLLLLQQAKLLVLKDNIGINATVHDIVQNPKQLIIKELDAAQLPRVLDDVALAAINTNYAIPANLYPNRDALFVEDTSSPYANIIVTSAAKANDPRIQQLVKAYQSAAVIAKAKELFQDQAIAAWDQEKSSE